MFMFLNFKEYFYFKFYDLIKILDLYKVQCDHISWATNTWEQKLGRFVEKSIGNIPQQFVEILRIWILYIYKFMVTNTFILPNSQDIQKLYISLDLFWVIASFIFTMSLDLLLPLKDIWNKVKK